MRLPAERALRLVALTALLFGAPALARAPQDAAAQEPRSGPAADYPVVVGEPFTIESTTYKPVDQLNYDAVGMAVIGEGAVVSAAHKTLPLPSYIEVTALDSGRTILVRVERRGPMVNDQLVELSAAAAAQLGISPGKSAPVRVRRVNPPEAERALLRQGGEAPERMATPEGLLRVLRRNLKDAPTLLAQPASSAPPAISGAPAVSAGMVGTAGAPSTAGASSPAAVPGEIAASNAPERKGANVAAVATPVVQPVPPKSAAPASPPASPAPTASGSIVVQVAAFSVEASARKIAARIGGFVAHTGKYWLVRMGPYPSRAKAAPALEKAKAAGYSDARIQPVN